MKFKAKIPYTDLSSGGLKWWLATVAMQFNDMHAMQFNDIHKQVIHATLALMTFISSLNRGLAGPKGGVHGPHGPSSGSATDSSI